MPIYSALVCCGAEVGVAGAGWCGLALAWAVAACRAVGVVVKELIPVVLATFEHGRVHLPAPCGHARVPLHITAWHSAR